ncbi:MAG TPA: Xaa-Pro peptidase family protein [Dongiaceae bacterium]|nr:Xaa-Pro peptidase family protein [Dongiaceae bacterium]
MDYHRLTRNCLYILTAHDEMQKSADVAYPFFQDTNFYYATRLAEPGWLAVINTHTMDHALLAPKRDVTKELFDGMLTYDEVRSRTAIATIIPYEERADFLRQLSTTYTTVHTLGRDPHAPYYSHTQNPAQARLTRQLNKLFKTVVDCRPEFARLRALKTADECVLMQRAVDTTTQAFQELKKALPTSHYEYELEALLNATFRRTGAQGHAYDPIVASGAHACTLHYTANATQLPRHGLVLIDAGSQVNGYAADVTRTYAIGTPTPRQIEVHAAVEKAHHAIIALIKPGVALKSYSESVDEIMKTALQEVGLLEDRKDSQTYQRYFPHAISHGLGLDVHESLGGYKEFMPGMVFTVEPGIYIPEEGIGVRIEDDILVTETGHENLSAALPTGL